MDEVADTEAGRDAICGLFAAAWAAHTPALNGGVAPEVEWPNVARQGAPLSDGNVPFARFSMRHHTGTQRTLGERGGRRFTRMGTLTVQIFVPIGEQGLALADRLSKVAVDAFEGESEGEVWFKSVIPREVGIGGNWYQINVTAEFQYDVRK